MHLVQILLPLSDNKGNPYPDEVLRGIQRELAERFGGVTAYNRSPAEGVWHSGGEKQKDDIVIVEVMADELDRAWWKDFRHRLESRLRQEEIVIRAETIERL